MNMLLLGVVDGVVIFEISLGERGRGWAVAQIRCRTVVVLTFSSCTSYCISNHTKVHASDLPREQMGRWGSDNRWFDSSFVHNILCFLN
jgi:hypothetical protein